ncbi:MAG: hypothetical protein ACRCYR_03730 [Phycicoccus sp.]
MKFQIDLDAARRERRQPEGLPVTIGGQTFTLPAELPLDVFDPFLDETFDLAGLIREGIAKSKEVGDDGEPRGVEGAAVDVLFLRPDLPVDLIRRVYAAFEVLFGPEQYAAFNVARPSLLDYAALFRGLYRQYGVGLGEAYGSLGSSGDGGQTPKPTSPASTGSTSETPSAQPAPLSMAEEMRLLESSESDGSEPSSTG